jgi:hypothetical protein
MEGANLDYNFPSSYPFVRVLAVLALMSASVSVSYARATHQHLLVEPSGRAFHVPLLWFGNGPALRNLANFISIFHSDPRLDAPPIALASLNPFLVRPIPEMRQGTALAIFTAITAHKSYEVMPKYSVRKMRIRSTPERGTVGNTKRIAGEGGYHWRGPLR